MRTTGRNSKRANSSHGRQVSQVFSPERYILCTSKKLQNSQIDYVAVIQVTVAKIWIAITGFMERRRDHRLSNAHIIERTFSRLALLPETFLMTLFPHSPVFLLWIYLKMRSLSCYNTLWSLKFEHFPLYPQLWHFWKVFPVFPNAYWLSFSIWRSVLAIRNCTAQPYSARKC